MEIVSVSIEDVFYDSVYDIETEAGTFLAGGLEHGIIVKNTDSCYIKFPINVFDYEKYGDKRDEEFMKEIFKKSEECSRVCTNKFKKPIELAFEKIMYPLILFAKKRYSYKEWTSYEAPKPGINYKGIQIVRRDTCGYVKEQLNEAFEIIMNQKSNEEAKKMAMPFITSSIKNLLDGNIDPNGLILSKQLKAKYIVRKNNISKTFHWTDPKIQQPHVKLAQKLKKENPANHPKPPDRVPYLFIQKKEQNLLQCDKVIHPQDFDPDVNKIDSLYYFDHQYKKPIDMVFQFIALDKKGHPDTERIYKDMVISKKNQINGQPEIDDFFKKKDKAAPKTEESKKFVFDPNKIEYIQDYDDGTGVGIDGEYINRDTSTDTDTDTDNDDYRFDIFETN